MVGSSKNNKLLVRIISSASFTFVCSPPLNRANDCIANLSGKPALAKKSLQEAIHVYPGTVFLVSHEADFYEEIVDRVIDIEELVK